MMFHIDTREGNVGQITEETELVNSITKVRIIKQLGEGNFGQVFLGSWGSTPVISPSKIWSPSDRWL
jgi:hypothetical protein